MAFSWSPPSPHKHSHALRYTGTRTHSHSLACTSDSKTIRTKGGASGVVATFNPIFLHSNSFSDNSSDGLRQMKQTCSINIIAQDYYHNTVSTCLLLLVFLTSNLHCTNLIELHLKCQQSKQTTWRNNSLMIRYFRVANVNFDRELWPLAVCTAVGSWYTVRCWNTTGMRYS